MLTKEWVNRSHYFFSLWVQSDDEDFRYSPEHAEGYEDSIEFVDWLLAQPISGPSFARGSDLRKLLPANP